LAAGDVLFGKFIGRVKGDQLSQIAEAFSPALKAVQSASGAEEGFLGGVVLGHFEDDSSVCKGSIIVLRLDSSVAAVEEKSDCVHCAFGAS